MMSLLVLKEQMKSFYAKYSLYVNPCIKFVFSFITFYLLNKNIGFMTRLTNPVIPLALSVLCAFVPYGVIAFLAAGFMLLHLWAVSFEITLIMMFVLLVTAILYYGFCPGDSYLLILTPLLFTLKIPYAIPLLVGLSGTIASVIPISCGVFVYYTLLYVKQNAGILTNDATVDLAQKYSQVIKNVLSNELMLVMILTFIISTLVVLLVRNLSIDYAWAISVIAGTAVQLMVIFVGDVMFQITVPVTELLVGAAVSALIAGIYTFFWFTVDYSRTEYVQFEDDDYYYYVKAVPKMTITTPDVKVQRISARKPPKSTKDRK